MLSIPLSQIPSRNGGNRRSKKFSHHRKLRLRNTITLLVVGTLVWSYSQLSAAKATFVVIAAFSFLSLLVGAILRVGGYISESGFLAVWKAGFKAVTSLKREGAKTDKK